MFDVCVVARGALLEQANSQCVIIATFGGPGPTVNTTRSANSFVSHSPNSSYAQSEDGRRCVEIQFSDFAAAEFPQPAESVHVHAGTGDAHSG